MTSLLHPAWGPIPPEPRELRLCRLPSSIVYLSTINEDCEYRVLQPSGSWDSFVISIVILISIGMLVLFSTALGANVSPPFLRSSVREVFQSAAASVLSMLSPVVPQADGPGASSERSVVDPADSVQATPETPESVHTELVELLRADGLGLISHEHSAVANVEPLANLGETHSQAESSEAREETRITVESLVNLGEACSRVESSEEREEANEVINNVEPLDDVIGKIAGLPARDGDGQQFTDRAQVGASPAIGPRASSLIEPTERASPVIKAQVATERAALSALIEPTERASPVVVLQASIVTDRARMMA